MPRRSTTGPQRLFVAAYPPSGLSQELLDLARRDHALDARWTPAHQVHVTLQFIGDTDPADIPRVAESVERACAAIPSFTLTFEALRSFPPGGQSKLIAAITDSPSPLLELHRRLAQRLARQTSRRHDDRFQPHLTLCRFVAARPSWERPLPTLCWEVRSVHLMVSDLHPSGSDHREVAHVDLTPAT